MYHWKMWENLKSQCEKKTFLIMSQNPEARKENIDKLNNVDMCIAKIHKQGQIANQFKIFAIPITG